MDWGRREQSKQVGSAVKGVLRTLAADYETAAIKRVVGFIPACEFVESSDIIVNLAYLFAKNEMNTCIVDFKVFYPTLYNCLGVEANSKGNGLLNILSSLDSVGFDVKNVVNPVKDEPRMYLLSPSPNDLFEEYYNVTIEQVEKAILLLREVFDVVLVDIPNNPPLEFCLGSIKACNRGYFVASERVEILGNMIKFLRHAESVGIGAQKFSNVIIQNIIDVEFDYAGLIKNDSQFRFSIDAKLPLIKSVKECSNGGKIYLRDAAITKKKYAAGLENIANMITIGESATEERAKKRRKNVRSNRETANSESYNDETEVQKPAENRNSQQVKRVSRESSETSKGIARLVRRSTGEVVPINSQNFLIGREFGLHYTISDNKYLGHRHCWIVSRNGKYYMIDNNSRNHTYIEGIMCVPNTPILMTHGQRVSIANEEFDFLQN